MKNRFNSVFTTIASFLRQYHPLILFGLLPIAVFYALEWFTHDPWTTMYPMVQFWNILFYELVFWLLFFLIGRVRPAAFFGTLFFAGFGLLNYFVMQFRSAPIVPWDIRSIHTAVTVADNYEYELTTQAIVVLLVFSLLFVISFFMKYKTRILTGVRRVPPLVLTVLLLSGYIFLLSQDSLIAALKLDTTLFTPHVMARKNGLCVSFLMDLKYMNVDEPEGYDKEELQNRLETYGNDSVTNSSRNEDTVDSSLPNIIVIMDEAFSDPAVLADFTTNEDYMPFLHSMQESDEAITGYLNVSVKGGNTANSEFEFLTGASMRFLPAGSVPYQQYIFDETPSLISWLEELGYETASIHPFNNTGWNRDKVYEYFGIDQILFNSAFHDPERIRKYISDAACFEKIQEVLASKTPGSSAFVFAVTMQNHSSYRESFDNFTPDITVEDAAPSDQLNLLQNYLSLMKITDQALQDLINELRQSDEKTIVIFFGDHQPNDVVVRPIWTLNGIDDQELTEEQDQSRYQVPYMIWANYDMEDSTEDNKTYLTDNQETSINYLASQVMAAYGLPLADWQKLLLDCAESYPVVSTQKLTASKEDPKLQLLEQLQYFRVFDLQD